MDAVVGQALEEESGAGGEASSIPVGRLRVKPAMTGGCRIGSGMTEGGICWFWHLVWSGYGKSPRRFYPEKRVWQVSFGYRVSLRLVISAPNLAASVTTERALMQSLQKGFSRARILLVTNIALILQIS